MLRTPDTDADPAVDIDDLSVGIQTRVSPRAGDMIKERAQRDGIKPATWVRITLYKALGIMKQQQRGRK